MHNNNNDVPQHLVDQAIAVINREFPNADAGLVDCPICIEDFGAEVIDLAGPVEAIAVINDASVYGALPRGTHLAYVTPFSVRLVRS